MNLALGVVRICIFVVGVNPWDELLYVQNIKRAGLLGMPRACV